MSPSNKKKSGKAKPVTFNMSHTSTSPANNTTTDPTTSPDATPSPPSLTSLTFPGFIELADLNDIKLFFSIAATTQEGKNLQLLWDRAFEEGRTEGRRALIQTLEQKLGYKEGFEEGKSTKIELFEAGMDKGRTDEHSEWIATGHGHHCLQPTIIHEDSSTQTAPLFLVNTGT